MGLDTNERPSALLATDGSLAARAAEHWASSLRWARPPAIDVLTVAGSVANLSLTPAADAASIAERFADLVGCETAVAEEVAEAVAARLRERGLEAKTTTRSGEPAVEILRVIDERRPDLVLLGSRGRSDLEMSLLGSVCQQVVRHAPVPLLVGRPGGVPPGPVPQRLLLLARSEASASEAAGWLSRMGWLSGSRVTVLALAGVPSGLEIAGEPLRGHLTAEIDRCARGALGATVEVLAAAGAEARLMIAHDHPLRMSLEAADTLGVDLIAVAAEASVPGRYPLAEKLARYTSRSVLVIPTT